MGTTAWSQEMFFRVSHLGAGRPSAAFPNTLAGNCMHGAAAELMPSAMLVCVVWQLYLNRSAYWALKSYFWHLLVYTQFKCLFTSLLHFVIPKFKKELFIWEPERRFSFVGSLPKCQLWPGVGKDNVRARTQCGGPHGRQEPSNLGYHTTSQVCISWKAESEADTRCSHRNQCLTHLAKYLS